MAKITVGIKGLCETFLLTFCSFREKTTNPIAFFAFSLLSSTFALYFSRVLYCDCCVPSSRFSSLIRFARTKKKKEEDKLRSFNLKKLKRFVKIYLLYSTHINLRMRRARKKKKKKKKQLARTKPIAILLDPQAFSFVFD